MDLFIYDEIITESWAGLGFGVSALDVRDQLALAGTDPVRVRINSPGGDCMAATAMGELLKAHRPGVSFQIDGLAASAAGLLPALVPGRVTMAAGGLYMIHAPTAAAGGDQWQHQTTAAVLANLRENLAAAYATRGLPRDQALEMMGPGAETYLTAAEALELGLVDEISQTPAIEAAEPRTFSLSARPGTDPAGDTPAEKRPAAPRRLAASAAGAALAIRRRRIGQRSAKVSN